MKTFSRFADLKARGIVTNRPQLNRMISEYGFPAGVMLTPNARAWDNDEISAWLSKRGSEKRKTNVARARETHFPTSA